MFANAPLAVFCESFWDAVCAALIVGAGGGVAGVGAAGALLAPPINFPATEPITEVIIVEGSHKMRSRGKRVFHGSCIYSPRFENCGL